MSILLAGNGAGVGSLHVVEKAWVYLWRGCGTIDYIADTSCAELKWSGLVAIDLPAYGIVEGFLHMWDHADGSSVGYGWCVADWRLDSEGRWTG